MGSLCSADVAPVSSSRSGSDRSGSGRSGSGRSASGRSGRSAVLVGLVPVPVGPVPGVSFGTANKSAKLYMSIARVHLAIQFTETS